MGPCFEDGPPNLPVVTASHASIVEHGAPSLQKGLCFPSPSFGTLCSKGFLLRQIYRHLYNVQVMA